MQYNFRANVKNITGGSLKNLSTVITRSGTTAKKSLRSLIKSRFFEFFFQAHSKLNLEASES